MRPKVLDLFCGMGGLSLGFALALEGAEVRGVDIDRCAVETYNLNLGRFGCGVERADLMRWAPPEEEFDIVIGGPPCQPFSTANTRRRGKEHPLFPTFGRFFELLRAVRPRAFLFENVPGLLRPELRPLLEARLRSLLRWYRIKCGILNAADYGIPQTRTRVIAAGVLRGTGEEFFFPLPTHSKTGMPARWLGMREALDGLAEGFSVFVIGISNKKKPARIRPTDHPSFTIMTKLDRANAIYLVWPATQLMRRLTSRELLRLQTFPDWWQLPESASESRKRKLIGEAVPPILAYRLAIALGRALGLRTREPPREEEWSLPYFRRAFADYFGGDGDG